MDRDYESESGSAESYEMKEKGVIEETMDGTVEDMIDSGGKKGSESASIDEEGKKRARKKRMEEIKRRERSNSI